MPIEEVCRQLSPYSLISSLYITEVVRHMYLAIQFTQRLALERHHRDSDAERQYTHQHR
jgi:hypothetical protein